jgi:hypothetical protein
MVVKKYFSWRAVLELFDDLRSDWAATVARSSDDRFSQFAIETIQDEVVAKSNMSTKTVLDEHRAAIREVIGRGNPGDPVCSTFFEGVVALAHKQGSDLALPPVRSDLAGHGVHRFSCLAAECASYCVVAAIGCSVSTTLRTADSTNLM